jgi:hypothetical protein
VLLEQAAARNALALMVQLVCRGPEARQ